MCKLILAATEQEELIRALYSDFYEIPISNLLYGPLRDTLTPGLLQRDAGILVNEGPRIRQWIEQYARGRVVILHNRNSNKSPSMFFEYEIDAVMFKLAFVE